MALAVLIAAYSIAGGASQNRPLLSRFLLLDETNLTFRSHKGSYSSCMARLCSFCIPKPR